MEHDSGNTPALIHWEQTALSPELFDIPGDASQILVQASHHLITRPSLALLFCIRDVGGLVLQMGLPQVGGTFLTGIRLGSPQAARLQPWTEGPRVFAFRAPVARAPSALCAQPHDIAGTQASAPLRSPRNLRPPCWCGPPADPGAQEHFSGRGSPQRRFRRQERKRGKARDSTWIRRWHSGGTDSNLYCRPENPNPGRSPRGRMKSLFSLILRGFQKRLASSVLHYGKTKAWLNPNESNEIANANSCLLSADLETEQRWTDIWKLVTVHCQAWCQKNTLAHQKAGIWALVRERVVPSLECLRRSKTKEECKCYEEQLQGKEEEIIKILSKGKRPKNKTPFLLSLDYSAPTDFVILSCRFSSLKVGKSFMIDSHLTSGGESGERAQKDGEVAKPMGVRAESCTARKLLEQKNIVGAQIILTLQDEDGSEDDDD
ncbi:hypothetical protein GH733_000503 [Mirounga leonina]|nr:hypothetical protein GH733_000503 [Mirounga leonina]